MFFPTVSEDLHAPPERDPNFFGPGSPYLAHPLLTDERTSREVDHLIDRLSLDQGQRVLDIGCGFGRHCIELARRGFDVVGIDPSPTMIEAGRKRAGDAGLSVDLRVGYIESLAAGETFDAAICLFTTLGQIGPSGPNTTLLATLTTHLRAGSPVAIEVPQRDATIATLEPFTPLAGGTHVERRFDETTSVVEERFHTETTDHVLRYELLSAEDLVDLVESAGYANIDLTSGYYFQALEPSSEYMLLTAERI